MNKSVKYLQDYIHNLYYVPVTEVYHYFYGWKINKTRETIIGSDDHMFSVRKVRVRALQLLTSACRFRHIRSQKVEAAQRTTRDDPKLAYKDNK
jgi:hypothetical protein